MWFARLKRNLSFLGPDCLQRLQSASGFPDLSSARHLHCCPSPYTVYRVLCLLPTSSLPSSLCAPPVGRDPASIICSPGPLHGAGRGQPSVGEDVCPGLSSLPQTLGATSRGGSSPSSGIVAAAGVVNQADEQRILLPGYFTTPGLHHTHPLQASLVGPGRMWKWGLGGGWCGGGQSACERLFSLAHWVSA